MEEIALTDAFPHANVRDVWKRLKELYFGTLQYPAYSWQGLNTALVPPPGVDLKWLLPLFASNRPKISIHTTADGCVIRLPDRAVLEQEEKSIWEVQPSA